MWKENIVDCDLRREMMQEIRCCEFAITELALYLDTHPDDQRHFVYTEIL